MATSASAMEDELYAMQLATASVLPMAVKAAIELDVFEIITSAGSAASLSPAQIASQLAVSTTTSPASEIAQRLDPILHLLSSHSVLTSSPRNVDHGGEGDGDDGFPRSYGLAPVAKYFLKDGNRKGSLAPLLSMIQDKVVLDAWIHLKDSVMEGGTPFNRAYGMDGMEFMGKNPRFREVFADSITEFSPVVMESFLERYCEEEGFAGVESLVDVGGGDGSSIHGIVSRVPSIRKAINFDLPSVVGNAPSYPGVEHVAGDMFEGVPNGDVIFMKWILHLWDDEQCVKIFKNCYQATPENGKVVIVDALIPETSETTATAKAALMFNLYRMSMKPQGKERTLSQFESLAKQAGFAHARIACFSYNFAVVEFIKLKDASS